MRAQTTKEKILIAARKEFVEHGYSGTSIGKIAKLAEVNHSLVFHHFGNKENLWSAVKQTIAHNADQQSKVLPSIHLDFKNFLHDLITNCISFYRENPDIVRMINWQRLEYTSDQKIGITLSTEMQAWQAAFKHYQQKGDINKKLKIEFIITFILSITSSAALDPNIFIRDPKAEQEYINFCVERLLQAFK